MNVCPFKKYKDILGVPRTGLHSYRVFDTAVVDYILTILVSIVTTYLTKIPLVVTTIIWLILGVILHILFGVETNTTKYLNFVCK